MSQDSTNQEPESEREGEGAVDQPRLVRPVEVKHGMVVTDLLNSQNLSAQKRKDASRKGMMSLSDIWPNVQAMASPPLTPTDSDHESNQSED